MKTLLFLGAGASIPFYEPKLTTSLLTEKIKDRSVWNKIDVEYKNVMGSDTNPINIDTVLEFIEKILNDYPKYNFEQIIEIIDKISSYSFDNNDSSKLFHSILRLLNISDFSKWSHTWDCIPFLCRHIIAKTIVDLNNTSKVLSYNELIEKFKMLITKDIFTIYSLNYDDIIFDAVNELDFSIGFGDDGFFNVKKFFESDKTLSFPHGHIRFNFVENNVIYSFDSSSLLETRFNNLGRHDNQETRYLLDSHYSYSFNTFIATGQFKENTFDYNPYAAYYQKLAADILKAEEIIIIGYSFGDYHFNRLFKNFLKLNPKNKLIVIDFFYEEINVLKEFQGSSIIKKILSMLEINSLPLRSNYEYFYQNDIDQLNAKGFGTLYPQIYFYKRGFDYYLNEFESLSY